MLSQTRRSRGISKRNLAVPSKLLVVFFGEYRPLFCYESKCTEVFKVSINARNMRCTYLSDCYIRIYVTASDTETHYYG